MEPNDAAGITVIDAADTTAAQGLITTSGSAAFRLTGDLSSLTDLDVYSITATAGQRLNLTILKNRFNPNVSESEFQFQLRSADGTVVHSGRPNAINTDPYLDFTFPSSGTFFLTILDDSPNSTSSPNFPNTYELQGTLD